MSQWYFKCLDFWTPCDAFTAAIWASMGSPVVLADPGGVYSVPKYEFTLIP